MQKHILSKNKFYNIFSPPFLKFYDDFFLPFFKFGTTFLLQLLPAFFLIWDDFSKILCWLFPALLVNLGNFRTTFYLCFCFVFFAVQNAITFFFFRSQKFWTIFGTIFFNPTYTRAIKLGLKILINLFICSWHGEYTILEAWMEAPQDFQ